MMTMTTRSSSKVNPAARDPRLLGLALSGPCSTRILIDAAPIFKVHCTQLSQPAEVGEHLMILHGFVASGAARFDPGTDSSESNQLCPSSKPGESRTTRYIVCPT